jgi:hypothetical protein
MRHCSNDTVQDRYSPEQVQSGIWLCVICVCESMYGRVVSRRLTLGMEECAALLPISWPAGVAQRDPRSLYAISGGERFGSGGIAPHCARH